VKNGIESLMRLGDIQRGDLLKKVSIRRQPRFFLGTRQRWELFSLNMLKGSCRFVFMDVENYSRSDYKNLPKMSVVVADYTHIEDKEIISRLIELKYMNLKIISPIEYFERYQSIIPVDFLSDLNFLNLDNSAVVNSSFFKFLKRIFDLFFSMLLLALILPFFPLLILVWMETKASPIYIQKRLGLNKKEFDIYKLRTMKKDSESTGAQWAKKEDPRITKLGKWLRKWRVDELPQLANVIKGDMSLIGPRPERKVFVTLLEKEIPSFGLRNSVKPGISGWAQVMHSYSACVQTSKEKLSYDLFYIKNSSASLEFEIFIKTILTMLLGKGM